MLTAADQRIVTQSYSSLLLATTGQFYCPPPGKSHWPLTVRNLRHRIVDLYVSAGSVWLCGHRCERSLARLTSEPSPTVARQRSVRCRADRRLS